jgi:hypothetical protein
MPSSRILPARHREVRGPDPCACQGARRNSLGHVNGPDSGTAAQIEDPGVFPVVEGSAVKGILPRNRKYLVKSIESRQLVLG